MTGFLNTLAKEFANSDLTHTCFVFPTRRAAYVFRQHLVKEKNGTLLVPDLFGIRDFVSSVSPLPIAEQLPLLLALFNVYRKFDNSITIEKFIPWGEIILHDFNEIDLQLISAEKLYERIFDIKEIEAGFAFDNEEEDEIKAFWKLFSNQELSPLQQTFLTNWEVLPKVYHAFKEQLLSNKFIYEGMAYRLLAEQPTQHPLLSQWNTIVFAGFYALSNAEEKIMHDLQKQNKAQIFWDVDPYYFEDKNQEAGKYLRKNKLLQTDFKYYGNHFNEIPKNIFITGVSMQHAQAKWLGSQIEKDMLSPDFDPATTVIVLPAEQLLLPVLYSLPETLTGLNITMGYPVNQSSIYSLLQLLVQLHASADNNENKIAYLRTHLLVLIQHPLLFARVPKELLSMVQNSESIFLSSNSLKSNDALLNQCFKSIDQHTLLLPSLINVVKLISNQNNNQFNQQLIDFVMNQLEQLQKHLQPYQEELNLKLIAKFISDYLRTLKIPFMGEPVSGVQIMGFLETRVLDFDHVYILSVNEDNLPASSRGKSYIPYSLRKSFGLPVQEDQDAVYAYHFYRLLQRAKNIHLVYNTEVKSASGGEKSRYLLQLAQEASVKTNGNVKIHFQQVSVPVGTAKEWPINIHKSEEIKVLMQQKYLQQPDREPKGLSASALNDYLHCTLRFYFKHIAGIKEPDEVKTELSPDVFGRVFHTAMQLLYTDHTLLDTPTLKAIESLVNDKVEEALKIVFKRKVTTGNDYLLLQIIKELVIQVLRGDEKDVPINILALEKETISWIEVPDIGKVKLRGFFDRIDEHNGIVRIIDYKTGSDKTATGNLLEKVFTDIKYKASFQLLLYSLMYSVNHPGKHIKAGIYPLQKATQGIDFLNKGAVIDASLLSEFTEQLSALIQDIFDSSTVFTKTSDTDRCNYCEFKNICQR